MRIAHLVPHLEKNGNGVVEAFATLAQEQQNSTNHDLHVVSRGGALEGDLKGDQTSFYSISPEVSFLSARRLVSHDLRSWRPDVIHVHTRGMFALVLGQRAIRSIPTIATAHSMFDRRERLLLFADRVVTVSEANTSMLGHILLPKPPISTVYNGVAKPHLVPEYRAQDRIHCPLLFIGGLYRRKGLHILFEALALLKEEGIVMHLDVLGDGPERGFLERRSAELQLREQVKFHGYVLNPTPFYSRARALVHPALEEPFGLVIAEAQQYALPIVGSNCGGIPEVLAGGLGGILVPPGNPGALRTGILRAAGSVQDASRWSVASSLAGRRWAPERMARGYDQLYAAMVQTRKS